MANQLFQVNENASTLLTVTFADETGGVPGSVTDILATLWDVTSGAIINSRSAQSVMGAAGGVYTPLTGVLTLTFSPADNEITGTTPPESLELHRLLLVMNYGSGRKCVVEFDINVKSIANE